MGTRRNTSLTQERLKSLLSYDANTGEFRWLVQPKGLYKPLVGNIAGSPLKSGHRLIKIDGVSYLASGLAWLYVHGVWPEMIDHRDLNAGNDRIGNLRLATRQGNSANRRAYANSKTGIKGVTYRAERSRPWIAQIRVNYKLINIGAFSSQQEASAAYAKAATSAFGEFARAA